MKSFSSSTFYKLNSINLYLVVVMLLLSGPELSSQIRLSTQAEVDTWDSSITVLTEDLTIEGPDITNVDALSNLTTIRAHLNIRSNPMLDNIGGLINIDSILAQGLTLRNNTSLQNIDGLAGLKFLGPLTLNISDNAITNVDGLNGLKTIAGRVLIDKNSALVDLSGISDIESISGILEITENSSLDHIPLMPNLNSVTGDFVIGKRNEGNKVLSRIEGFPLLDTLEGRLSIAYNDNIRHVDFLSSIKSILGELNLESNDNMTNIDGLINIGSLDGALRIAYNDRLSSIQGLSNLNSLDGSLILAGNVVIQNLDALDNIGEYSGALTLADTALPDIDFFSGWTNLPGTLRIINNSLLENYDGLSNLRSITGKLDLEGNVKITHVDALSNLTSLPGVLLIEMDSLVNTDGLLGLSSIEGQLLFHRCWSLTNIDGLRNLVSIPGFVQILQCYVLDDTNGFLGLSSIEGALTISICNSLTNLDGLTNLSTIGGQLSISNCDSLRNIDGLSGVNEFLGFGSLSLVFNENLNDCCGMLNLLLSEFDGNIVLFDNGPSCYNEEIVLEECVSNLIVEVYNDTNNNCLREPDEIGMQNVAIKANNNVYHSTDANGEKILGLYPGQYEVSAIFNEDVFSSCNNAHQVEVSEETKIVQIPMHITRECADLSLGLSTPILRRCFERIYHVEVLNSGSQVALNTILHLELDPFFEYISSEMDLISNNGNDYFFDLGDIDLGELKRYEMVIKISCEAMIGQVHYMTGSLRYDNPCVSHDRLGKSLECRRNVGSYDPNDKTLFVDGFANAEIIGAQDTIEYMVRFQNTGTDTAFTVRIEDELSPQLHRRSLRPFVASHAYDWELVDDKLIIHFENINLVDSTTNEPASHGFIKFKVAPDEMQLEPGDLVHNEANIFFDFNNPILTNKTEAYYLCKPTESDLAVAICEGSSYFWEADNTVYSVPGNYEVMLTTDLGCDSTVYLNLTYLDASGIDEIPYNGLDDDCNVETPDDDLDSDGFLSADDCDDNNPNINPGQSEEPYNGLDDDCNEETLDDDLDRDGFTIEMDCDDDNIAVNPAQTEIPYNGINDDCDSETLDDDLDQDGFLLVDDCNDTIPTINPNAVEIPNNGIDEDCDGMDLISSVHKLENSTLNIYPNPTIDLINIAVEGQLNYQVGLYDIEGKLIKSSYNSSQIRIDAIPSGTYLLKIMDLKTGQKIVERIIIGK